MCPDVDDLIIAFVVGDEAHCIVAEHFLHLFVALAYVFGFFFGNEHVAEVERQASLECHIVTEILDIVEELRRTRNTARFDHTRYDVAE